MATSLNRPQTNKQTETAIKFKILLIWGTGRSSFAKIHTK
jgi:hypothetical protein